MSDSPKAVGYVRVSTGAQATEGVSLEVQRQDIARYAIDKGYEITGWYADEGISGGKNPDQRPGLLAALGAAESVDALIVWKRDRLCRAVPLMCVLEKDLSKKGVQILSVQEAGTNGESPEACLLRRLLDAIAEHKSLVTKMRTRRALAFKREKGEMIGSIRFGYRGVPTRRQTKRGTVILREVEDECEQETIRQMKKWRESGESYREIAHLLNANGVPTHTSKPCWWPATVQKILLRERKAHDA